MASGSIVDLTNRALASIGSRSQVQSLNEGSAESNAANIFITPVFETLARTARWGCLKKQAQLSLIAAAPGTPENPEGATTPYPPQPWRYSYSLPSDCLFVRQLIPPPVVLPDGATPIFPTLNTPGWFWNKNIRYEVAYGTDALGNNAQIILTNLTQAYAIYTVNQPNPQFWDSMFQQAFVASLAAYLVPALSLDKPLMQMQIGIAEKLIMQARAVDGNESPVSQSREASWISARNGSSGILGVGQNGPFLNYEQMSWPL
jgi:hypothetical protein